MFRIEFMWFNNVGLLSILDHADLDVPMSCSILMNLKIGIH